MVHGRIKKGCGNLMREVAMQTNGHGHSDVEERNGDEEPKLH